MTYPFLHLSGHHLFWAREQKREKSACCKATVHNVKEMKEKTTKKLKNTLKLHRDGLVGKIKWALGLSGKLQAR